MPNLPKMGRRKKDPLDGMLYAESSGFWNGALKKVRTEMIRRKILTAKGWGEFMQRGAPQGMPLWGILKDFATDDRLLRDPNYGAYLSTKIAENPEVFLWFLALFRSAYQKMNPIELWLNGNLRENETNDQLADRYKSYEAANGRKIDCDGDDIAQAMENIKYRVGKPSLPEKVRRKR